MNHRFGRFELDEERRELRHEGRELVLRPRVFDLIVYLVRNRERVASRDELLRSLWPGTIVSDGSLQRAISLARSTLENGGLNRAIRTFSRQAYRFCAEVDDRDDGRLGASDLEQWALSRACIGKSMEGIPPLERASAACTAAGDPAGAARVALYLARILFENRDVADAKGWFRRAENILKRQEENQAHGHLEWIASRFAIFEGEYERVARHPAAARDTGERTGDDENRALGLLDHGHALLTPGDVMPRLLCTTRRRPRFCRVA